MDKKMKTHAERFTSLIDNNWKTEKSKIRMKLANTTTYDPTYSWEAKFDNPKEFTKLEVTTMPFQPSQPIVLSQGAVVTLETNLGMAVFNGTKISKSRSKIPLTQDQKDVGMKDDLSGNVPMCSQATENKKTIILSEPIGFKNMNLHSASFKEMEVPKVLLDAGPQCDKKVNYVIVSKYLFV
jgi:hypothetical protein